MRWGLSLYLECGHYARDDWKTYPRASDAAKRMQAKGDREAKRNITFEHARPLNVMYQMLLDERATLTLDRVAFIIGEYPPVLVTIEENDPMSKLGFCGGGAPEQRYAEVPFSGFSLRSDGATSG
jgi:hypothetical protein